MFTGLVLTSISAAVMHSALFQRKSRSGWLEELDGIREDALDHHDGGVANVVDAEDIWTDLRDGGEYDDPHEISSLYATDATPDLPVSKPPAKASRSKAKPAPQAAPPADAPPPPVTMDDLLPPPPAVVEAPLPPPPAPAVEPAAPAAFAPEARPVAEPTAPGSQYDDQIWVQPAPHPIRPSEMWHPAELAPPALGEESFEPLAEERVASADLMDPTYRNAAAAPAQRAEELAAARAEAEAAIAEMAVPAAAPAPAPVAPEEIAAPTGGLVTGPVGRRVRRDRPKASLPGTEDQQAAYEAPAIDRGEQSPLPSAPLPPAALPTRSNRLPDLESLPATPSSVVQTRSIAPAPIASSVPVVPAAASEVSPVVPAVAPAPAPVAAPAPVEEPAPAPIAIGADGMIDAPGTIVRIGGARRAHAAGSPDGVVVALDEGWCWASPGEGAAGALRIELPSGALTVEPGATALAVVEADRSVFIIVAAGSAYLSRGDDGASVARGTIVMVDPSGIGQTDAATDAEIEADPIVAENLALDAEL